MRIGKNQIKTLVVLGSPTMAMVVPGETELGLIKRGLLRTRDGGMACITPAGLRVLADEMEAGRVDDALERMRKDVEARQAKKAAREQERR